MKRFLRKLYWKEGLVAGIGFQQFLEFEILLEKPEPGLGFDARLLPYGLHIGITILWTFYFWIGRREE